MFSRRTAGPVYFLHLERMLASSSTLTATSHPNPYLHLGSKQSSRCEFYPANPSTYTAGTTTKKPKMIEDSPKSDSGGATRMLPIQEYGLPANLQILNIAHFIQKLSLRSRSLYSESFFPTPKGYLLQKVKPVLP